MIIVLSQGGRIMNSNSFVKIILAIALGLYVISPVDLMSGSPIDDFILVAFTVLMNRPRNDRIE